MQVLGILQVHGRPTHVSNQAEKEGLHYGGLGVAHTFNSFWLARAAHLPHPISPCLVLIVSWGKFVTTAATRTKPDRGDVYINVARHPVRSAIDKLQIG